MTTMIVAVFCANVQPAQIIAERWASTSYPSRFVERVDTPGAAVQTAEGVTLLSENGNVEVTMTCPPNVAALYYDKIRGLVMADASILFTMSDMGERRPLWAETRVVFAVGRRVFVIRDRSLIALLDPGPLVIPLFDEGAGVALSADGRKIAVVVCPMSASMLKLFNHKIDGWQQEEFVRTPEVLDIGLCTIWPSRNDMRFIGDKVLVFIGGFSYLGRDSAEKSAKTLAALPTLDSESVADDQAAYLFGVRISDGLTVPLAKISTERLHSERIRGPRTGGLTLSADGRHLFLLVHDTIWRVDCDSIVRRVEQAFQWVGGGLR